MVTLDEWFDRYKPILNPRTGDHGWDGTAFETYGADDSFIRNQPTSNVWTWVDGDNGTVLLSGYHYVNRIAYFVCEVPETRLVEVPVESYDTVA